MKKNIKPIKRMLVIMAAIIMGFILIITCVLLIYSPGKLKPYVDNNGKRLPGSISEKVFITVGGIKQGMFIKSKNINNPVLLYVHGGPAFPNYFLIDKFNPDLEDYFTVCYWEQRGGGLSYSPDVTLQSMNFDQLASDAIEVTNYLRKRFGNEKIYMIAHSGGTPIALLAASREPQLYYAYIAMAQITKQNESERIAYKYMLEQYSKAGKQKIINELKKYRVLESDSNIISFCKSTIRDKSMHELGIGTMRNMKSVISGIFIPVWICKAYTFHEKINIWKSKFFFLPKTNLINEMLLNDFTIKVPRLDIPVYFFSGKYDLTVNIDLAKDYLNHLEASVKGFYTFDKSAHSPILEEPQKVKEIIEKDVLNCTCDLADKK
jgi:pimeloyl-ACP methyl ester carboxylesterase